MGSHSDPPAGRCRTRNAQHVTKRLLDAADSTTHGLVVDLAGLSFLDTAGVHALLFVRRQLAQQRQRLLLVSDDHSPVERIFDARGRRTSMPDVRHARDSASRSQTSAVRITATQSRETRKHYEGTCAVATEPSGAL